MGIRSLFAFTKTGADEIEGAIRDLRVVRGDGGTEWIFRVEGRDDAEFAFTPTPLSPARKAGQRVRVGFQPQPDRSGRLRAEWIAAA